ncbi:putative PilT domain-containing protein [Actinacidiphila reveromycinica]|uniref:Putative PilT domain-containing protein n=1 Tax=Actinacidiphila reveromycinica TaxID=659352 RepID=A0A7U3UUR7_9ACTN|nr:putative PilT domain-containing protein [Streptomyces sp. SN-593]
MPAEYAQGLLATGIVVLCKWIDPAELPAEVAITAITLAERGRRLDILQRAENEFDPIPFDTEAARIYGRVCAAVIGAGRKPRRRVTRSPGRRVAGSPTS